MGTLVADRPGQPRVHYVVNRSKQKGTRAEVRVRDYLRENGFPHCERLPTEGSKDRGDLAVPGICIEVKNERTITLASYMDEVATEKANAGTALGVAIILRRGKAVDRAYVVQELGQWVGTVR